MQPPPENPEIVYQDPNSEQSSVTSKAPPVQEIGGRKALEPTRYGDWEKQGRCIDF